MKKKTVVKIKELDPKTKEDLDLPSKITMTESGKGLDYYRKIKIQNDGGSWTNPKEKRLSLKLYDSCNSSGKPEVTIKLRNGSTISMSFLDMCNLFDILAHSKDLGLNLFNDTELV